MLSTLTSCPVEEVLAARGGSGLKDIDISTVRSLIPNFITWDYVKRVREVFPGKLLLKGIVTREDGELAVRHGLDGIVVSNHGGRAEESYIGTIESLREVIEGTRRRIPVLVDSGFRRGTDIFKALALGATAVGVGRPYACVDDYEASWLSGRLASWPELSGTRHWTDARHPDESWGPWQIPTFVGVTMCSE